MIPINLRMYLYYCLFFFSYICIAQNIKKRNKHDSLNSHRDINFSLDIKNMHLWRGYQVTSGAMTGASIYYLSPSKNFKTGFWGGAGFDGKYKEVCFYVNYQNKNFFTELLNSFNSTNYDHPDIFSFNRITSPHYVDITLGYNFPKLKLKASLSTVVLGRDIYTKLNGDIANRFSHYTELKYTAWATNDSNLKIFVGGAFSFIDQTTFYSSKPNFVNIGLEINRTVTLLSRELPLSATFRINPDQRNGALEFAAHF